MTQTGYLSDRSVIVVTGPDTREFLQRVITTDMGLVKDGVILPGALLTPQGKVLSDFLIHGRQDGVMIDVWCEAADSLIKRLSLYRLRAKAEITKGDDWMVTVGAGSSDPRSNELPARAILPKADARDATEDQHHAEILLGVPAFGRDYVEAEVFPTDVNLDLYGGIGWKKGCFIGQEVLSRMKRRGTIRKRTISLGFEQTAADRGTPLLSGDTPIGVITSSRGQNALARVRTDRMQAARAALMANGLTATPGQVPE